MSSLTPLEKRTFERLFNMGNGYVLNFSNRTLQEFVLDTVHIDIYDAKYDYGAGSKANRLRKLWQVEPDHVVAQLLSAMIDLVKEEFDPDADLVGRASSIVDRLSGAAAVDDLASLAPNSADADFEILARAVHDSISAGQPEVGLDRLHTFVMTYVGVLANQEGIVVTKDKPLHSLFGEVIKALRVRGVIETEMAERILKSTISTFESFNRVRNERTFAHPNPYSDSMRLYSSFDMLLVRSDSYELSLSLLRRARSLLRLMSSHSTALPNKQLLQTPQTLVEGAHVLRHARQL